jgi:two-component system, chemotaxis family, CheB/CheR fusion protein
MAKEDFLMPNRSSEDGRFSIVGIGASAGGLDACERFCRALPVDTGMAFVLIQHLDPNHKSMTVELLARHTKVPVSQAEDGKLVEPNHLYVIPPNRYLTIKNGLLHLAEPDAPRGMRMAVDHFLRSLAVDREDQSACIILSGTGADGSLGAKAIHGAGGIVLVQEPSSAQYDGMPRSALATGAVDLVLKPEDMPQALVRVARKFLALSKSEEPSDGFQSILDVLRVRAKHDFRAYKDATIRRRILRRMGLRQMDSFLDYSELLGHDPDEVHNLYRDLLIGVTSFFRDPETWEVLAEKVIPQLVERASEDPIRVWVPGCSSGEEAYSVAILLAEAMRQKKVDVGVLIFASDIDAEAIEKARMGLYPESIVADMSPERLQRFFIREGSHYRVSNLIRERVLFANQNLIGDPPFSKLDLICCRNLLIYFRSGLQSKVFELFHFALKEDGILFLGASESLGSRVDLFRPVSKKQRIFQKLATAWPSRLSMPMSSAETLRGQRARISPARSSGELVRQILLDEFAPAAVLLGTRGEALYYSGPISDYLEIKAGEPNNSVLDMVRQGLRTKLRAAVHRAWRDRHPASFEGRVKRDRKYYPVRVMARPVPAPTGVDGMLLVTFQDVAPVGLEPSQARSDDDPLVCQLEAELSLTRDDLQNTVEEYEASNEELKASNEEVMSMVEELQSSNEELETSKEELQSVNEELATVNSQLEKKVDELSSVNSDVVNLLQSTAIATIFLDRQLCLKLYTPSTRELLNLIPGDLGRPVSDITQRFSDSTLLSDAAQVLQDLTPIQKKVQADTGRTFLRRVLPYRTIDDHIDGVVITFVDITELQDAQLALLGAEQQLSLDASERAQEFQRLADRVPALFSFVGADLRFQWVNKAYEVFGHPVSDIAGKHVRDVVGHLRYSQMKQGFDQALLGDEAHFELASVDSSGHETHWAVSLFPRHKDGGEVEGFFEVALDMTEQVRLQKQLHRSEEHLKAVFDSAIDGIISIDAKGKILTCNRALQSLFGYTQEELVGQNVRILMPESVAKHHDDYLRRYQKTGKAAIIGKGREVLGRRKDGTEFPIYLGVSPINHLGLYAGILRDLTEAKLAEERMLRSERLAGIGEAMTGMVHESRNALARAQAHLRRLSRRLGERPELHEFIDGALEAQQDIQSLFEEVRSYAAPVNLETRPTALKALVDMAWSQLSAERSGRDARLVFQGKDLVCQLDNFSMIRVLRNIFENALAACPDPVRVKVSCSKTELKGRPAAQLSISDNGPGLSEEQRQRVFEAFYTTRAKGTGLGMAIAHRLVEAHRGLISVGTPKKGAEFIVVLPQEIPVVEKHH